jgi:hypothetical protein
MTRYKGLASCSLRVGFPLLICNFAPNFSFTSCSVETIEAVFRVDQ